MVGLRAIRVRTSVASASVNGAGDRVVEHAAGRQRRERAELCAERMRSSAWTRVRRWAQPWPQPLAATRPAHERRPAARGGAHDRKHTILRPHQPNKPPAVRPRSQCRGDDAERVEMPPGDLCGHHEHDRAACAAHVSARQDLHNFSPMRPAQNHRPGPQPMAMEHQSSPHRPARRAATRTARRPRHGHIRRPLVQPPLDVYAGSDNSKLALSLQVVRSTTGTTRLATRGSPSPFRRPALRR